MFISSLSLVNNIFMAFAVCDSFKRDKVKGQPRDLDVFDDLSCEVEVPAAGAVNTSYSMVAI